MCVALQSDECYPILITKDKLMKIEDVEEMEDLKKLFHGLKNEIEENENIIKDEHDNLVKDIIDIFNKSRKKCIEKNISIPIVMSINMEAIANLIKIICSNLNSDPMYQKYIINSIFESVKDKINEKLN